jgi:hypothetical protein
VKLVLSDDDDVEEEEEEEEEELVLVEVVEEVGVGVVDVEDGEVWDGGGGFDGDPPEFPDPPWPNTTILAFDPCGTVTTQNAPPPAPFVELPMHSLT